MKIASIVGARPQFIKLAPIVREIKKHNKSSSGPKIKHIIIHTGQHYDYEMNKLFFDELGILEPVFNLEVGSGSHGWQTGEMIKRVEKVLLKEKPNWVLVYGDTNSTFAGALASSKLHLPTAHIEAGLRSYNRAMPEELNRVLADHCSDILLCPTENAVENLKKEGFKNTINKGKLIDISHFKPKIATSELPLVINAGDIMYDALLMSLKIAEKKLPLEKFNLKPKEYYLATIHRSENTDNKKRLQSIIEGLSLISEERPVIFPIHPRTKKNLKRFHILPAASNQITFLNPVSYFEMLVLEKNAIKILTDSGGVQKEAYLLRVPCITLRDETEWLETTRNGWNILVKPGDAKFLNALKRALKKEQKISSSARGKSNCFGNGGTAEQIIRLLIKIRPTFKK